MKIIAVQLDIAWEDKPANHAKVRRLLDTQRPEAGSLVLLPEMFSTGFSMNVAGVHDTETNADRGFLRELARSLRCTVIGGLVTRDADGKGQNHALVVSPEGEERACYTKLHPFAPGKEAMHYVGGADVCTFEWAGFTVAPFVCYDLRFPEAFRRATRVGANLLTVIANWPAARIEHWITLARARAIENQAYVVAVNRCGNDPWLAYPGRSLIVDPKGNVLADAGDGERVIGADVDLAALQAYRKEMPFLADMRDDLFPARR